MSRRTSFNVQGQYLNNAQKSAHERFMEAYRPPTALYMDDVQMALNILELTDPDTLVIHRMWHPHDGDLWRKGDPSYMTPKAFIDAVTMNGRLNKNIWLYLLNEPPATRESLQWLIDTAHEGISRGYRCIVGNIGPATIQPQDIESGMFADYLEAHAAWSVAGVAYAGWHEYTAVLLPFGIGQWPVENLLDPDKVRQPWPLPTREDLEEMRAQFVAQMALSGGMAQVESYPPWWHLLRHEWLQMWAEENGIGRHKAVITECGWDRMGDLARTTPEMPKHIYQLLEEKWGAVGHFEIRGPKTLANIWKAYFPDWSFSRVVYEQCQWLEQLYPPDVIGWNLFTWCFDANVAGKEIRWE